VLCKSVCLLPDVQNLIVFVDITKSGSQTIKHGIIGYPMNSNNILYETAVAYPNYCPGICVVGFGGTMHSSFRVVGNSDSNHHFAGHKYRNLRRNQPAWWHVVGWQYLFIPFLTSRTHEIWYSHIFKIILISTVRSYLVENLKLILIFYKICYTNKNEVLISIVKPNRCTSVSNFFYFGLTLYMFRTVVPSIIRISRLYIQLQAYVKEILLSAY